MEQPTQGQTAGREAAPAPQPGNVLISLYDAAIRNLCTAQTNLASASAQAASEPLHKTAAILEQLIAALDYSQAPELCDNLEQLYKYMLDKIHDAHSRSSAEPLVPVIRQLANLREAWAQVVE